MGAMQLLGSSRFLLQAGTHRDRRSSFSEPKPAMPNQPKVVFCEVHTSHQLIRRGRCWKCEDLKERLRHGGSKGGQAQGVTKARCGAANGRFKAVRSKFRTWTPSGSSQLT